MTRLLHDYYVSVIWYICIYGLDVKDRVRGGDWSKFTRVCAHISMARNYGADVRNRIASDTLAYDKGKIE